MRPGDFLRRIYEGISGRIKAFDFAFIPISSKVLKRAKIERESNNTQIEEIWQRRKKKWNYFNKFQLSKTKFNEITARKKKRVLKPMEKKTILGGEKLKNGNKFDNIPYDVHSEDSIWDQSSDGIVFYDIMNNFLLLILIGNMKNAKNLCLPM